MHIFTAEIDTSSLPLRYLLLQNHISVCLGERQRGHGGVQLIFCISASRSTITQPVDLPVLYNLFLAVQLYWFFSLKLWPHMHKIYLQRYRTLTSEQRLIRFWFQIVLKLELISSTLYLFGFIKASSSIKDAVFELTWSISGKLC